MKLKNIKNSCSIFLKRTGLKLKKYSPEILTGIGIISMVSATIIACKETENLDDILDEHKENMNILHEELEDPNRKDVAKIYISTFGKMIKNYYPAATLEILGVTSVLAGHNILRKRNVALMAAYKTVEAAFSEYRARVKEELGEDVDRHFRYGTKVEEIKYKTKDENGKEKTAKEAIEYIDPSGVSQYARFFDSSCKSWTKSPEYNFTWLKGQQDFCTDLLRTRGHLFLNEVYDALGIPRTQAGAVVGWVLGDGDDYVDFGLFDKYKVKNRDFVNGYESVILLDFNVCGVIYDKI